MQNKPVIVALDYDDLAAARALVAQLDPSRCRVKVGKEMFTLFGPQWVRELVDGGFDVFLDLKFHDIPNTVAKAVSAAAQLGVWMVNVHASGGVPMMQAAVKALSAFEKRPLLTAVTVLTSMDEDTLSQLGVNKPLLAQVEHLASLAQQAGVDGVVCSAQEAQQLKAKLGNEFLLVTPGVRPAFAEKGDQHRIMTPKAALTAGADYLVIGRPITQAAQPAQALQLIEEEIAS